VWVAVQYLSSIFEDLAATDGELGNENENLHEVATCSISERGQGDSMRVNDWHGSYKSA
jgi:hypothetical protein